MTTSHPQLVANFLIVMDKSRIKTCDECSSLYTLETSKMSSLCPQCSHVLYGYELCTHEFINGRCVKCYWDGSVSDYLQRLLHNNDPGSVP